MSENNNNLTGRYRQGYVPKLAEGNPEKQKKTDWWDEVCKAHGEKNHWKKDKNKK